jgi:hypothetical protein
MTDASRSHPAHYNDDARNSIFKPDCLQAATPDVLAGLDAGLGDPTVSGKLGAEGTAFPKGILAEVRARQTALLGAEQNLDGTASETELSPDRAQTLATILKRYDEYLDRNLYTETGTPKSVVEAFLKADPSRLDALKRWEDRGGMPMFTGEKNGLLRFSECSAEVPLDISDICYGPVAAEERFGPKCRSRNALDQAEKLGGELMPKEERKKLLDAGLIGDNSSYEWLAHPDNSDTEMGNDGEVKDYGLAWIAGCGDVFKYDATAHGEIGGFRCSLSGPRP